MSRDRPKIIFLADDLNHPMPGNTVNETTANLLNKLHKQYHHSNGWYIFHAVKGLLEYLNVSHQFPFPGFFPVKIMMLKQLIIEI